MITKSYIYHTGRITTPYIYTLWGSVVHPVVTPSAKRTMYIKSHSRLQYVRSAARSYKIRPENRTITIRATVRSESE
jgi:hypothetical protein